MKISVIIPVYNIEKYLSQCVESIISQTYEDLEIILIDDGSTDNSPQICNEFAKKDKRIIVIHKANGGAASARNTGLRRATGECLAFVDSDDYLEEDTLSKLAGAMSRTGADIVECAFANEFLDKTVDTISYTEEIEFSTTEYLKCFLKNWTCGLACNKLFKKEVLKGVFYEEGHQIDDEFFTYQGVINATKIVYIPDILYHYRMRASSVMRDKSAGERMLLDRLDYSTKRRANVVSRFPELKQEYDYSYLDALMYWSQDIMATEGAIQEIQRLIKDYFKTNKPCKMKFGFRFQLLQLQYSKPERIIMRQSKRESPRDDNQYYE